jgi:hypothetical protein
MGEDMRDTAACGERSDGRACQKPYLIPSEKGSARVRSRSFEFSLGGLIAGEPERNVSNPRSVDLGLGSSRHSAAFTASSIEVQLAWSLTNGGHIWS